MKTDTDLKAHTYIMMTAVAPICESVKVGFKVLPDGGAFFVQLKYAV